jgi:drug/metabolite transporter (DMT)-like permease
MCYRSRVLTPFLIAAVVLVTVAGQLLLKHVLATLGGSPAMSDFPEFLLRAARTPLIYGSLAIQACSYVLWMVLISRTKLGVATASVGAGFYLCTALTAWGLYGETLSYLQWLGLMLITAGVICVGLASA